MSERLIVKFEKGTGGPVRTAIGDLVPTYIARPLVVPEPDGRAVGVEDVRAALDARRIHVVPDPPVQTSEWGLMLSDVRCDGEFDGVSPWYQIAFSHIITVRPFRDPR